MKQFTDSAGRSWGIVLNIGTIRRVKAEHDGAVDLADLSTGDPPLASRLVTDIELVCGVLYAVLKPEIDKQGLTPEEFAAGLGGQAIAAGQTALLAELEDFFRQLGRTEQASMIRTSLKATALAIWRGTEQIDAMNIGSIVDSAFGNSSGSVPESSDLTPTDTRSASLSG